MTQDTEKEESVTLYIYDLSQGLARQFSQAFLGKQVDGIWHTGVVYNDTEYFFGQGIMKGRPGQVMPMPVVQKLDMGKSSIPTSLLQDFLEELQDSKYSTTSYNLLQNNCNNFSDDLCQFLVGENIPSYISGLPQEVLNSNMGPMLMPLINQVQNQMSGLNSATADRIGHQGQAQGTSNQHSQQIFQSQAQHDKELQQESIEEIKDDIKHTPQYLKEGYNNKNVVKKSDRQNGSEDTSAEPSNSQA